MSKNLISDYLDLDEEQQLQCQKLIDFIRSTSGLSKRVYEIEEFLKTVVLPANIINGRNAAGDNPLVAAADREDHTDIIKLLLSKGGVAGATNSAGQTFLDVARAKNRAKITATFSRAEDLQEIQDIERAKLLSLQDAKRIPIRKKPDELAATDDGEVEDLVQAVVSSELSSAFHGVFDDNKGQPPRIDGDEDPFAGPVPQIEGDNPFEEVEIAETAQQAQPFPAPSPKSELQPKSSLSLLSKLNLIRGRGRKK